MYRLFWSGSQPSSWYNFGGVWMSSRGACLLHSFAEGLHYWQADVVPHTWFQISLPRGQYKLHNMVSFPNVQSNSFYCCLSRNFPSYELHIVSSLLKKIINTYALIPKDFYHTDQAVKEKFSYHDQSFQKGFEETKSFLLGSQKFLCTILENFHTEFSQDMHEFQSLHIVIIQGIQSKLLCSTLLSQNLQIWVKLQTCHSYWFYQYIQIFYPSSLAKYWFSSSKFGKIQIFLWTAKGFSLYLL